MFGCVLPLVEVGYQIGGIECSGRIKAFQQWSTTVLSNKGIKLFIPTAEHRKACGEQRFGVGVICWVVIWG
ncbi:unnamed protein product [Calypogeia fissa]